MPVSSVNVPITAIQFLAVQVPERFIITLIGVWILTVDGIVAVLSFAPSLIQDIEPPTDVIGRIGTGKSICILIIVPLVFEYARYVLSVWVFK